MCSFNLTKNRFFILSFLTVYIVSLMELFLGNGLMSYLHPFDYDSFMDLFSMAASPYNTTYPPLSMIPFKLLHMIKPDLSNVMLRMNSYGAFYLMLYMFSFAAIFLFTIFFTVQGDSKRKMFYSVLFLFSGIMLWTIERANVMSFAFLFSLLFVVFYTSEDESKIRISYILMALAISLKLYPGIFILLLVEKKDWKGILSVVLYTGILFVASYITCMYLDFLLRIDFRFNVKKAIILFMHFFCIFAINLAFLPFAVLVYKQKWKIFFRIFTALFCVLILSSIMLWIFKIYNVFSAVKDLCSPIFKAILFGKRMTASVEGVNVSFKNFILLTGFFLTKSKNTPPEFIFQIAKATCLIIGIFTFAFSKETWKKLTSLSLLCAYIPDFSGTYLLVYMIIPTLFFINDRTESKQNYIAAFLLAMITTFIVIPYKVKLETYYKITGSFIIMVYSSFLLYSILFLEATRNFIKSKKLKKQ